MLSRLHIAALLLPAQKGMNCWFLFVMFNCFLALSQVVSGVMCGTRLYRFLICAAFLSLIRKAVWEKSWVYLSFPDYLEVAL